MWPISTLASASAQAHIRPFGRRVLETHFDENTSRQPRKPRCPATPLGGGGMTGYTVLPLAFIQKRITV